MKPFLIVGAIAAYVFRAQLEAAIFGTSTTAAPTAAPAITNATTAANAAAAGGAPPAQQAAAAQVAAIATPPTLILPTIATDNATVHKALVAESTAPSGASLVSVQQSYGLTDSSYLLTIYQWNWYYAQTYPSGALPTDPGTQDNAIPASQYLAIRQSQGLA